MHRNLEPRMKVAVWLVGLALLSVGPTALVAPETAAAAFGIPAGSPEARAYLIATAMRDVALGGWLIALLHLGASRRLLAASMLAIAIAAASDAANLVAYAGWSGGFPLAIHTGGLAVLLAAAWWLWREERTGINDRKTSDEPS